MSNGWEHCANVVLVIKEVSNIAIQNLGPNTPAAFIFTMMETCLCSLFIKTNLVSCLCEIAWCTHVFFYSSISFLFSFSLLLYYF